MKIFGIVLNALLYAGYLVYLCSIGDVWEGIIFGGMIFGLSLYIHLRICNTPTKSTEYYNTWRDLLPDDGKYKILRWVSIVVIVYIYVVALFLYPWFSDTTTWWKQLVSVCLTTLPSMLLITFYAKGKTLEHSKQYYKEVVEIFGKRNYEKLEGNVGGKITPDTNLLGGMVRTDNDLWTMVWVINDILRKYEIRYSDIDSSSDNSKWQKFVNKCNSGALQDDRKNETIKEGIELSRLYCMHRSTVGGIAIWINDSIETKQRKEAQSQLD